MGDITNILNHLIDTVSIVTDKPIQINDVTDKGLSYWTVLTSCIALISICFVIYDRIKKSIVYGKIISVTLTEGFKFNYIDYIDLEKKEIKGEGFTIKISLGVYKKDLYFTDVNITAIFKDRNRYNGEIYWVNSEVVNLDGKKFIFKIPPAQFLTYNSFIEKNKVQFFYLKFVVPNKAGSEIFKSIELEFVKPNKARQKVSLDIIEGKQVFFDEDLHTPV